MKQINECSKKLQVESLYVFGSYAKGLSNDESDVDILYSFNSNLSVSSYYEYAYLLKDELQKIFSKKVDLLESNSIVNPYLREEIENSKKLIYEA